MELRYLKSSEKCLYSSLELNKHITVHKNENRNNPLDVTNTEWRSVSEWRCFSKGMFLLSFQEKFVHQHYSISLNISHKSNGSFAYIWNNMKTYRTYERKEKAVMNLLCPQTQISKNYLCVFFNFLQHVFWLWDSIFSGWLKKIKRIHCQHFGTSLWPPHQAVFQSQALEWLSLTLLFSHRSPVDTTTSGLLFLGQVWTRECFLTCQHAHLSFTSGTLLLTWWGPTQRPRPSPTSSGISVLKGRCLTLCSHPHPYIISPGHFILICESPLKTLALNSFRI